MTPRQSQLLAFLRQRVLADDVCPTFDEMAAHPGLKSKSSVKRIIDALEARGFIAVARNYAGALPRSIIVAGIGDYARGYRDGFAAAQAERRTAA